jgi:hypothetical protein
MLYLYLYYGYNKEGEIGGECGTREGEENPQRILMEKFEGKKPPGTPGRGGKLRYLKLA